MTMPNKESQERTRPNYASDDRRRAAIVLFEHGIGYARAAWILGVPVNTVRDWNRAFKAGKFTPTLSYNQFRYDEKTRERVRELRRSGMSWRELSAATGVPVSSCRKWVGHQDSLSKNE